MSDPPYFSIILPTYNRASWLPRTIQSVIDQSEPDFELLVIDDGSTDETREVVKAIDDPRIKYHYQDNAERGAARNKGVQMACGKYVHFLDSDDVFFDGHLAEARRQLTDDPVLFYFQPYCMMDPDGNNRRPIPRIWDDPNLMLVKYGNYLSCHGIFLKRNFALENPFQEDRHLAGSEDIELWLRLAARTNIKTGHKVTSALVEHPDRSVLNFNTEELITRKEKLLEYLQKDPVFMHNYGRYLPRLKAVSYFYIAVHFPKNYSGKTLRLKYWWKAVRAYPLSMFSRRSLVVIKQTFWDY